jgi:hypothetical protein
MKHVKDAAQELRGKAANHRHEERKNREYAEAYELAAIIIEDAIEKDEIASDSVTGSKK